jgi:hypothetical protein
MPKGKNGSEKLHDSKGLPQVQQKRKLSQKEGHRVVQKSKNFVVVDYEKALAKI